MSKKSHKTPVQKLAEVMSLNGGIQVVAEMALANTERLAGSPIALSFPMPWSPPRGFPKRTFSYEEAKPCDGTEVNQDTGVFTVDAMGLLNWLARHEYIAIEITTPEGDQ